MKRWVDGLSIEEHLGPAERRFFGDGFRRVGHRLADVRVVLGDEGRLEARAHGSLRYPGDWSVKGAEEVRPHLSTVDAFVMAVELAELLLVHLYGLDAQRRTRAWVRSAEFRAGARPLESLDRFVVTASVESTRPHRDRPGAAFGSVLRCRVGPLSVRLAVEHDIEQVCCRVAELGDLEAVLGDASTRFYGSGYATHRQVIDDVRRTGEGGVSARVRLDGWDRPPSTDLGADYRPTVSLLDATIGQPQLAQALLYHLDGLDREDSHTLWMRRAAVAASTPCRPVEPAFTATADIVRTRLTVVDGATFRSSDFVGSFQGIACTYSLAHRLPDRAPGGPTAVSPQKG